MLAGQILSLLQGSLAPVQQTAQNAAAIRTGQGVSAAGVEGNQAKAINPIHAQTNAAQAQAIGSGDAGGGPGGRWASA